MTAVVPLEPRSEEVVEQFEHAWQSGLVPRLTDFLPPASGQQVPAANHLRLLHELIKIDLEYRWRRPPEQRLTAPTTLDAYVADYPEVRQAEAAFVELLAEEYRCRHRWADQPRHAEYLQRHPAVAGLRAVLYRVDRELAVEFAEERAPARVPNAPSPVPLPRIASMGSSLTAAALVSLAERYHLLDSHVVTQTEVADLQRRFAEPRSLAREMLQRSWLTPYQVNQLFLGRTADLWLEPYVLLERLGEGGMGQVFKARHADMRRIVAIKLIRNELLADADTVNRFRREVQGLAQLAHPHVVHAYDAGLTGPIPFLVMEYIDGIGLGRLVRERGALPVPQACDYVRQAALGLQHLHENGLVHRDIKPANLLVAGADPAAANGKGWGIVKVMDLGLARLSNRSRAAINDTPTASGAVMLGTLDYMAPEQALDFRVADIRADIYSLGCVLYFLLTGQPPFPEGTPAQKLLSHQIKEPPLRQLRPELPKALVDLILRTLAKSPSDRPQTPVEFAALLDPFTIGKGSNSERRPAALALPVPVSTRASMPVVVPEAVPARNVAAVPAFQCLRAAPLSMLRQRWPLLAVSAGLMGVVGLLAVYLLQPPVEVFLSDLPEEKVQLRLGAALGKKGDVGHGPRISVGGKVSPKGICTPPPGSGSALVSYRLNKQYRQFKATVATDDSFAESPTPLTFAVIGDGKVLWQSKPVKKRGDEQECDVRVAGVDRLELTVSCPGTDRLNGHTPAAYPVWIEPRLLK